MATKPYIANKSRILFLLQYLHDNTDNEHIISTNDLLALLEENGFQANRHTLRGDMEALNSAGYDVVTEREGKTNTYHCGNRKFELSELKMVVEAVASSSSIDTDKRKELVGKLSSLTSKHMADQLTSYEITENNKKNVIRERDDER